MKFGLGPEVPIVVAVQWKQAKVVMGVGFLAPGRVTSSAAQPFESKRLHCAWKSTFAQWCQSLWWSSSRPSQRSRSAKPCCQKAGEVRHGCWIALPRQGDVQLKNYVVFRICKTTEFLEVGLRPPLLGQPQQLAPLGQGRFPSAPQTLGF